MMKSIRSICLFLGLLGLWWPQLVHAQGNFNDIDDVIYIGDQRAIVVNFDESTSAKLGGGTGETDDTFNLGNFLEDDFGASEIYFFSNEFIGDQLLKLTNTGSDHQFIFGRYDYNRTIQNFNGTKGEFTSRIVLTWDPINDADGYLIFRDDLQDQTPIAVISDPQITTYEDFGLLVGSGHDYYISAYSLVAGNRFITKPAVTDGATRQFTFLALAEGEAKVNFEYEFDNHLLLDMPERAARIEFVDQGSN